MKKLTSFLFAAFLTSCMATQPMPNHLSAGDGAKLEAVLAAQNADFKVRYAFRHPEQTLRFFNIKPGMIVAEILPGGGWYSRILAPYIGPEGTLIGVDYSVDMFRNFDWANADFLANRQKWGKEWQAKSAQWVGGPLAKLQAYSLATVPGSVDGTVDSVLFIRALHNLSRFEAKGGYRTQALKRAYEMLKPGGTLGIVQHQVGEDRASDWADGSRGYLKKSDLIQWVQAMGFELVAESAINENPLDKPSESDIVWRLPPSLRTSGDNENLKAQYLAIGESNRMTLLFKKPK